MFISSKRHEREKQELLGASNRLTEALLKHSRTGILLLDAQGQVLPQVSQSLATLLRLGRGRFAAFLKRTDASMTVINTVLKKPAREEDAFRGKLDEILEEVDRVRKDAAAFKFGVLESSARTFEDALHDLRGRRTL